MPAVYTHEHTVNSAEIDWQRHANNIFYLHWFLDAAIAHSDVQGWNQQRYLDLGMAWVAKSHFIEYHAPAFEGDALLIRTWISEFRRVTSQRRYEIRRAGDEVIVATAESKWAFVDVESGAPRRIPDEVQQAFEVVVQAAEE
jgi:acyl-CoA thioester hydrolase